MMAGTDKHGGKPIAVLAPLQCPIAQCTAGAALFAVRRPDGRFMMLATANVIDQDFACTAAEAGRAEDHLRFASACTTSGCAHWTDGRCGVIDGTRYWSTDQVAQAPTPDCPIRPTCQWHHQSGEDACKACLHIVSETAQPLDQRKPH